jgi:hypothetical protein
MNAINRRFRSLTLLAALLVFACTMPTLVPTPAPLPSATPTWTLLPLGTPIQPSDTPAPTANATTRPSATPGPTQEAFNCPNAPAVRVKVGDRARVTFTDGLALRVRSEPEVVSGNVVVQIPEGTEFEIIGGPVCAPIPDSDSSYVFWLISIDQGSTTGWVAEGGSSNYFLEKLP